MKQASVCPHCNKVIEPFKVEIIESERGWGSKIDEIREFNDKKSALEFIREFNSKNNSDTVPDWYMYAQPNNFKG